jgi:hypothetical protein
MSTDGKATSEKYAFSTACEVSVTIKATPEKIWDLLTNASKFTTWNSTVIRLTGNIAPGGKIELTSTSDPKRVFKLSVSEFVPPTTMVWSDGNFMFNGVRTYYIQPRSDGTSDFTMREVFKGLMMPMIGNMLPDFKPFFEQFAQDLKKAAEASSTAQH